MYGDARADALMPRYACSGCVQWCPDRIATPVRPGRPCVSPTCYRGQLRHRDQTLKVNQAGIAFSIKGWQQQLQTGHGAAPEWSSSVDTSVACSPSTLKEHSAARPRLDGGPYTVTPGTAVSCRARTAAVSEQRLDRLANCSQLMAHAVHCSHYQHIQSYPSKCM